MELVRKVLPYTILFGCISWVLINIFDSSNGLIQPTTINGITIYTFDLRLHLKNIADAADWRPLINTDVLPARQWIANWTDAASWWNALTNNIAYVFDWLYMPINTLLLLPARFSCWITKLFFTVFGVGNDNVIMDLLSQLTTKLIIPYI